MPRYEQLKAKSKGITYTRQIRNESKEINLKKPLIISIAFIAAVAVIFSVVKKYSPMVDIAVKDFFSINHREALALESDGISEDADKMSFLSNIPLFNFFIKTDTNETLSIMTYETNSKIEAALDNNSFTNSNIISRESLLPFFNNTGSNNSILYDSDYVDYGNNHASVLFSNNNTAEDTNRNVGESTNSKVSENNYDKPQNYLEQIILENRNKQTDNNSYTENTKTNSTKKDNTVIASKESSIFNDILKPKQNTRRETTTMKPSATTTFSTKAPSYMNTDKQNDNTQKEYDFDINDYLKKNNGERIINNRDENRKDIQNNNSVSDRKQVIQDSVYSITNSLDRANVDYNRVINDMVNPSKTDNNNIYQKPNNNFVKEDTSKVINNSISKKDIMQKAQNDINNYNIRKANNSITRDLHERELKSSDEGIYLVEYNENTGSITLIFRERKFNNSSSIEEAIRELLNGATDAENKRNIISCIPKGTELLDIFVEGNTVYLNFNEDFEFNPLGNDGTMVQIYQFVYTATQFKDIDNVIFLINGQLNETIGSEGAIENMPFRRFE
ncbi:GerMN domain-containing protein [uncultured Brachyspira sp.]|uniref:GerMN domain-containing protein n=1 Tax=uncultured Brachyspira sp. TaxID=221953 RepID=UPI00262902F8|nr:GerMN domain-containing protein [uncultured Brachyspira sp.]